MDKDLFDHNDYREYLLEWLAKQPKRGRGLRSALAAAMRSPVSHVSQVLAGVSDLSSEQAEDVNDFLGHSVDEAEYFLLLVQFQRAGTAKLKARIETQLKRLQQKRLILKDRLQVKATVSREDQAVFYSTWHCAAVHILLTIEKYQKREAVAAYLGLPLKKTTEILEFLVSIGLAQTDQGKYLAGQSRVHLSSDSPVINKHHINWRLKAIQSLEREDAPDALHYSSVVSLSSEDVTRIKSLLVKAIENAKAVIRDSNAEELHSFCLDFFKV